MIKLKYILILSNTRMITYLYTLNTTKYMAEMLFKEVKSDGTIQYWIKTAQGRRQISQFEAHLILPNRISRPAVPRMSSSRFSRRANIKVAECVTGPKRYYKISKHGFSTRISTYEAYKKRPDLFETVPEQYEKMKKKELKKEGLDSFLAKLKHIKV